MTQGSTKMMSSDESKYRELLTTKAFSDVEKELLLYQHIDVIDYNFENRECTFQYIKHTLQASLTECECLDFKSMDLPCRHIFATRAFFNEPIFDKKLCSQKWLRQYCLYGDKHLFTAAESEVKNTKAVSTLRDVTNDESVLLKEKYNAVFKSLVHTGSLTTNESFKRKFYSLKSLFELWKDKKEVLVTEKKITDQSKSHYQTSIKQRRCLLESLKPAGTVIVLSKQKTDTLEKVYSAWKRGVDVIITVKNKIGRSKHGVDQKNDKIIVPGPVQIKGRPQRAFQTYVK